MARYRIRKGDREFEAEHLDTLQQLASRGLLSATDEIATEGGVWTPASEVVGLADQFAATASPDALLEGFLDQLASTGQAAVPADFVPVPARSEGTGTYETADDVLAALEGERPPSVPAMAPSVSGSSLPPVPPPAPVGFELAPPPEPPRLPAPPSDDDEGDVPVTFREWLENTPGNDKQVLQNFGAFDDRIFTPGGYRHRDFNILRVLPLAFLGGFLVFSVWIWIRTSAQVEFPTEAELIAGSQLARITTGPTPPPAPVSALDRLDFVELKGQLRQVPTRFGTAEELEDVLLVALSNFGVSPLDVEVDAVETRKVGGLAKPVQARLSIILQGVRDVDDVDAELLYRLAGTLVVVAHVAERAQLRFPQVEVRAMEPTPIRGQWTGPHLDDLWNRRTSPGATLRLGL